MMINYKLRSALSLALLVIGVGLLGVMGVSMTMPVIPMYIKWLVLDGFFAFAIGMFVLPFTLSAWDEYEAGLRKSRKCKRL